MEINDLQVLLRFHKPPTITANFKRIRRDSEETKPCRVENNTKTVNSEFLSQASMSLILVFTQLF